MHFDETFSRLYSASDDLYISVYDINSSKPINQFAQHKDLITSLKMNNEGNLLFSGSLDGYVKIFDIRSNQVVESIKFNHEVWDLSLSLENGQLAVGTEVSVEFLNLK